MSAVSVTSSITDLVSAVSVTKYHWSSVSSECNIKHLPSDWEADSSGPVSASLFAVLKTGYGTIKIVYLLSTDMNHWTEKIKPLAIEYKSKGIIFVYADEETNYDIIQDLGIREGTISELIFTITKWV